VDHTYSLLSHLQPIDGGINNISNLLDRAHTGEATSAQITNGSVSIDLSNATVDAKSLGLKGYQVMGVTGTDIGTGSASTSVEDIVTNTTNLNSVATSGYTDFYVYGAGFAGGTFADTTSQVLEFIVGGQTASITVTVDTNLAGTLDAINADLLANRVTRDASIYAPARANISTQQVLSLLSAW
jgi:hypothetical protein